MSVFIGKKEWLYKQLQRRCREVCAPTETMPNQKVFFEKVENGKFEIYGCQFTTKHEFCPV